MHLTTLLKMENINAEIYLENYVIAPAEICFDQILFSCQLVKKTI